MANPNGHPATLTPFQTGNQAARKHGLYSKERLPLSADEQDELDALLALPHVVDADRAAAEEIVRLRTLVARVDAALADGTIERRGGEPRKLLDHRRRLSAHLLVLLESFGLTPRSRADWVRGLASGGLAEEIRRRAAGNA